MSDDADETITNRLESLISWYDTSARRKQYFYKGLKLVSIILAGAIPVVSLALTAPIVTATLGALVVGIEGSLQLYRFHDQWLAHRYTCEALKHEKYLYVAGAKPYADPTKRLPLLALRVERLVEQETAAWRALEVTRPASPPAGAG